jgi:transcriptional regulator
VSDAPSTFIEDMLSAIVGLELKITRLEGKWKMSQNRPVADREGVISALESLDSTDARETAKLVKATLRS